MRLLDERRSVPQGNRIGQVGPLCLPQTTAGTPRGTQTRLICSLKPSAGLSTDDKTGVPEAGGVSVQQGRMQLTRRARQRSDFVVRSRYAEMDTRVLTGQQLQKV